ncbi:MAG: hypothetical protein DRO01_00285 [Thermoproteota archaeon]|nr:MAG: hypothetical protein DRO01_00285 [Candidatus Korarchaeota archaeon]
MLLLFEDEGAALLRPPADLTPAHELVIGRETILERVRRLLRHDGEVASLVRPHLVPKAGDSEAPPLRGADEGVLAVNSRWVMGEGEARLALSLDAGEALAAPDGTVLCARLRAEEADSALSPERGGVSGVSEALHASAESVRVLEGAKLISYPWNLLRAALEALREPVSVEGSSRVPESVRVLGNPKMLSLGEGVEFEGPAVLDVRGGPIHISDGVTVGPHVSLSGPLHVGPRSAILPGAQVSNSYVGPVCKVGGELADSVVLGYSNKAHYGYVGHSYVGRWVNVGAGTATSDLKNTYGEIRKTVGGRRLGTGTIKLGSFVGDHAKTAIGAMLYTGLFAGAASHLHGFVLEDVPPFTIYAVTLGWGKVELGLESAIRTYERMAARRSVQPSEGEEQSMRLLFELTRKERDEAGVRRGRIR